MVEDSGRRGFQNKEWREQVKYAKELGNQSNNNYNVFERLFVPLSLAGSLKGAGESDGE